MDFYLFIVGTLINLRNCCLQLDNFKKLIFANKNWLNEFRVDYKSPCSVVELIETNVNSKEE
jgi:hypothetical protein